MTTYSAIIISAIVSIVFINYNVYGFGVVIQGKDCPGNNVKPEDDRTLVDCMTECNNKANCIGIVHADINECFLKTKCLTRDDSRVRNIYLKPKDGFLVAKGIACPSNDFIIEAAKISVTDCMIKCNTYPGCIAITYDGTRCWGKSKCDTREARRNTNIYFKPTECPLRTFGPYGGNGVGKDVTSFSDRTFWQNGFISKVFCCTDANGLTGFRLFYGKQKANLHGKETGECTTVKVPKKDRIVKIMLFQNQLRVGLFQLITNKRILYPCGSVSGSGEVRNITSGNNRLAFVSGRAFDFINQMFFTFYD